MVTESVDGGGGHMIRCNICGQYYDPIKHFGCPHCSGGSQGVTEALYNGYSHGGGNASPGGYGNGYPVTEPVGRSSYPGSGYPVTEPVGRSSYPNEPYNRGGGNLGGATEVAQFVEKRSPEITRIAGSGTGVISPVVGWLIAINGPCKGTDYRLHAGYNYIGRERGDICIHGDLAISKERDSCINYDQAYRTFYITHENGINQTQLNGRSVRKEAAELYDYDVITIGQTKLLFMSLCGEKFNW